MKKLFATCLIVTIALGFEGSAFAVRSKNTIQIPDSVFQSFDESNLNQVQIITLRRDAFNKMDISRNGKVSKDEFIVYEKTIFIEMNKKDDAVLTADEINKGCMSYFICLDANQDKQVTAQEFNAQLEDVFYQIDGDGNNYISRDEYLNYLKNKDKAAKPEPGKNK